MAWPELSIVACWRVALAGLVRRARLGIERRNARIRITCVGSRLNRARLDKLLILHWLGGWLLHHRLSHRLGGWLLHRLGADCLNLRNELAPENRLAAFLNVVRAYFVEPSALEFVRFNLGQDCDVLAQSDGRAFVVFPAPKIKGDLPCVTSVNLNDVGLTKPSVSGPRAGSGLRVKDCNYFSMLFHNFLFFK